MRHHSSAHLLQKALQVVLGNHVHQEGSYVSDTMVRFDFSHYEKMTTTQLMQVEKLVNEYINEGLEVETKILPLDEAKKLNAMALFDEKYGDLVRVIDMGGVSVEFCGGTHVGNTQEIGSFAICYEESIASGVRRIEARTGLDAYELLKQKEITLENVREVLKAGSLKETPLKSKSLMEEVSLLKKTNSELNQKLSNYEVKEIYNEFEDINGKKVLLKKLNSYDKDIVNKLFDSLKVKYDNSIIVLANVFEDKVAFMSYVSESLRQNYSAGDLIKKVTSICLGSGGGRRDVAQGGGKAPSKVDEAFKDVKEML